ncbi:MAG: hypothetical protein CR982_00800 [Candidatus Cloacimonadota bacterium]|nr:MAG: hypothetical protein CR982_00800 [Candidatus Cloacimonadota bacterium]PIE78394.1 MAG: hypothetical protein CSA15_07950 [Candidatus Delongbacteria bacterium]
MESMIIRINLIVSIIYIIGSFLNGGDYRVYLINAIIIFSLSSIILLTINYFLIKTLLKAKIDIVREDMCKRFLAREQLKKVIEEQERLKRELEEEKEKKQYERLFKTESNEGKLGNE